MRRPPAPVVTALWTRLMRAAGRLQGEIEAALKAAGLPPLAWYDVLWELERAGTAGLRPYQLQERLLLPQYGTSRLVERIVEAGLVRRRPCPEDGRGQVLELTDAGRDMRIRIWPVYRRALEAGLASRLDRGEAVALARLLERLGPAG